MASRQRATAARQFLHCRDGQRRPDFGARFTAISVLCVALVCLSGCQSLFSPISGVPAHRLPPDFFAAPKNNLVPIDISRLRQDPPRAYLLDSRDILGVYIEGVLGTEDGLPPVHMPAPGSDLPPALGYPVPVRDDGTIVLPYVPPLLVRGLTLTQAEDLIRKAYTIDQQILQPGKDRILVTLMKERYYNIVVLRQDGQGSAAAVGLVGGMGGGLGIERNAFPRTQGFTIQLPAYQNDVLHALAATGGLPGPEAKAEVKILRGTSLDARRRDEFIRQFLAEKGDQGPCLCAPPIPDDPSIIRIPLRLPPGHVPTFRPEDIILQEGDTVLIESRETEVFYTGGMLGGGVYPLPRDYDLDVITALYSVGGGSFLSGRGLGGLGGGGLGGLGGFGGTLTGIPPGRLYVLRRTPCGGQVIIDVDLARAIRDPAARPLVQAGDVLILQYKPIEELANFGAGTFFAFGITEIIRKAR